MSCSLLFFGLSCEGSPSQQHLGASPVILRNAFRLLSTAMPDFGASESYS